MPHRFLAMLVGGVGDRMMFYKYLGTRIRHLLSAGILRGLRIELNAVEIFLVTSFWKEMHQI